MLCHTIWAIATFISWRKHFDMVLGGFRLELAGRDGFNLRDLTAELELINSTGANGHSPTLRLVVRNGVF